LIQCLDLNFYKLGVGCGQFGQPQHFGNPPSSGDVVLFDQHRVKQTQPMVFAAAGGDRVFLRHAQARQGLAGVDNAGV